MIHIRYRPVILIVHVYVSYGSSSEAAIDPKTPAATNLAWATPNLTSET